jgi:acyl-CoA-binding protein
MIASSGSSSDLTHQFQQAADRVASLAPEQAGAEMHTLYGLYKQATDGDHDTFRGEVGREDHDNPDGPAGLSQAQWDSWSRFKGMSQEEAMRQYVAAADKIGGTDQPAGASGKGDGPKPAAADADDDAPNFSQAQPTGERPTHTPSAGADPVPGGTEAAAANAGLRGDLRAGATYGSEEELKEDDDAQRDSEITES